VLRETKQIGNIEFHIQRKIVNGSITKNIEFEDKGHHFAFKEEVKALTVSDFERYFDKAGLKVESIFGDYELNTFEATKSDRLIFICKKA
jgi:hypothetical protein